MRIIFLSIGILCFYQIRNISVRQKEVMHALEYLDFPDESK